MGVSFKLDNVNADIVNLKTNTDTDDDGKKDIKAHIDILAEVPAELMDQLSLGDAFSFKDTFFTNDGDVKNVGIETLNINRKFDDHRLTIQHDKLNGAEEVKLEADIHKIKLSPLHGHRFALKFRAQTNPGINNINFITGSLISDCTISVEPMQTDLEDGEE